MRSATPRLISRYISGPLQMNGHTCGAPAAWVEAGYYVVTVYAIMCTTWGIAIPMLGAGLLGLLAVLCWLSLGATRAIVARALVIPFLCGMAFLGIQIAVHDESILSDAMRPFVTWMLALSVVQALALRRGFLHRFALFAVAVASMVLPYLTFIEAGEVARAGLEESVGISNPNELAAWLGFCCLYFTIVGLETRYLPVRLVAYMCATGCALIVGLTVSRATLLAVVVGIVVACRRVLKRGFVPVLALCAGIWIVYALGLFDVLIGSYAARGTEETGRLDLWPLALQRFVEAPFVGVGASRVATFVPQQGDEITPHNSFLYFGLAGGVMPLVVFLVYWWRAASAAISRRYSHADRPFYLPLLVYAFLISMATDAVFMAPWATTILAVVMSLTLQRFAIDVRASTTSHPLTLRNQSELRHYVAVRH